MRAKCCPPAPRLDSAFSIVTIDRGAEGEGGRDPPKDARDDHRAGAGNFRGKAQGPDP